MRCYFKKTCRFVIPRSREYGKAQLALDFFYVATHFSTTMQGWFFSNKFHQKLSTCRRKLLWKTGRLYVLRLIPHSPKITENAIITDLHCYSNWLFSATTGLSSWIKISIKRLTPVEVDSIEKLLILIFAWKSFYSNISRKLLFGKIHLDNRNGCSQQKQIWFPSWWLQSATLHLEKKIQFKLQSAGFLHQNSDTPKNRKFCFRFCFSFVDIQSHNSLQLQASNGPKRFQVNLLIPYKTIRLRKHWPSSLHWKVDSPKSPHSFFYKWFISSIEMVSLRNYRFDFPQEVHNQQPYF